MLISELLFKLGGDTGGWLFSGSFSVGSDSLSEWYSSSD